VAGVAVELSAGEFRGWANGRADALAKLDLGPVFRQGAVLVAADLKARYQRSVSPEGLPWAALKRPRRRGKGRKKGKDLPLLDTGRMRAAVQGIAQTDGILAQNTAPYAGFHQDGTRRMAARPNVGFSTEFLGDFEELLADHVAENLLG
jgi:phage gpG-like protein